MLLRKSVEKALSLAVIGVAFSGVALGQVAGAGPGNATATPDVQIDTDAAANVTAPPVDTNASTDIGADGSLNNATDTTNGVQADVNATARSNDQNVNSNTRSNINGGVTGQQNRAGVSGSSSSQANSSPFGATFDSRTTDRLVIQNLQPNSTASRLGLRAGDRIVSINGQTYTDGELLDRDLAQMNASTDVPITYERDGQSYTQRFRMSGLNSQQTYNGQQSYSGGNYGNQGGNGYIGQASHSVNRPMYGGMGGDMYHGQNGMTTTAGYGCGTSIGSDCCGDVVQANACYDGHRHHRQRHGRRHHRNHCR